MTLTKAQPSSSAAISLASLVHVVVAAVDGDQGRVVDRRGDDLRALQVLRHHHHRLDPGPGGRRSDGVGQVAGRRTGQHPQAQLAGRRQGDGHHPVLEGVGRVARVVLHPELSQTKIIGEVAGVDQPGEAGVGRPEGRDVGRHRQQRGIAPDASRTGLDLLPGHVGIGIADLERTEALQTGVERAEGRLLHRTPDRSGGWRCRTPRRVRRPAVRAGCRSSRSSRVLLHLSWAALDHVGVGTVSDPPAGCRGVIGPVPRPLWMNAT